MSLTPEQEKELTRFPVVLRDLVASELAAGNAIAELTHGFLAAPCGAYPRLMRPVGSRPRRKTLELYVLDQDSSDYSGVFMDAARYFFVLDPSSVGTQAGH